MATTAEKAPYTHEVLEENIKREQHGTGPFENVNDLEANKVVDAHRNFRFLSLSELQQHGAELANLGGKRARD